MPAPTSFGGETVVVLDNVAVETLLTSPEGPVARDMILRGNQVRTLARELIHSRTGKTASSIVTRYIRDSGGFNVIVGSSYEVMVFLERGTRPHEIRPVRAQALRFEIGNKVVFAKVVHHPGTAAQHILLRALEAARR